jgi:hypothetical protein
MPSRNDTKRVADATTKLGRTIAEAMRLWVQEAKPDEIASEVLDRVREGFDVVLDAAKEATDKARARSKSTTKRAKRARKKVQKTAKKVAKKARKKVQKTAKKVAKKARKKVSSAGQRKTTRKTPAKKKVVRKKA